LSTSLDYRGEIVLVVTVRLAFAVVSDAAVGSVATGADSDGDGVTDATESTLGTDPNDANSDGDGTNDATEALRDTDGDGTPGYRDLEDEDGPDGDFDRDGLVNSRERSLDTSVDDADTDGDGTPDYRDDADEDGPDGDLDSHGIAAIDETTKSSIVWEGSY
jgi:hypothetical protein